MSLCGFGMGDRALGMVERHRYICPWCDGFGEWSEGERCYECSGVGTTDSPSPGMNLHIYSPPEVEPPLVDPEPIPRPPGVMRTPCVDCAFRRGSPEMANEGIGLPAADSPFYCHHGLVRRGNGYLAGSTVAGRPLGALVCANWWALHIDGAPLAVGDFRDPGGADRSDSR